MADHAGEGGDSVSLIYEPKGKAREYSPLALNIYTGGCDHGCEYCYCRGIGTWTLIPRPRNLTGLAREAGRASRQILLCFMGDPYCAMEAVERRTREALEILRAARCSVAILTKGGTRCIVDVPLFDDWPDGRIKVGATLTFLSAARSAEVEPGAALPSDRIDALRILHERGIKTWASIEPVIDAAEALAVIKASLPYVDAYKVGKLNHRKSVTDWRAFGSAAVDMIRSADRSLYIKDDLRAFLPAGFLTPAECNPETVFLSDRPADSSLL
jgi:hypothetical protein